MGSMLGGVMGVVGGISKYSQGRKMEREGKKLADSFNWEELQNAYKNNQVSTMGSDVMREDNARLSATMLDILRSGGGRALMSGLGRVQAQNNKVSNDIAINLDEQQKAIDMAASGDDAMIRQMTEKRQTDELAGYGGMINGGMNLKNSGIGDMVNGISSIASGAMGGLDNLGGLGGLMGNKKPKTSEGSPTKWI